LLSRLGRALTEAQRQRAARIIDEAGLKPEAHGNWVGRPLQKTLGRSNALCKLAKELFDLFGMSLQHRQPDGFNLFRHPNGANKGKHALYEGAENPIGAKRNSIND